MYRFTIPGVYYYSSGYLDNSNVMMQGVVKVQPLVDESSSIVVYVGGIEAKHMTGGDYKNNLIHLNILLFQKKNVMHKSVFIIKRF